MAGFAKAAALVVGGAALGGLAVTLKQGAAEWAEHAKVAAQTEAALKSTGSAANVTAGQIEAMANALLQKSGIDDEAIQSGENMLLTFTNIRNEAGKGNDIFNQTTQTLVDMATAMNGGATPSAEQLRKQAIQLGKAMNDPIKGLSALRRVGVAFTAGQQAQIKALVQSGQTMEAQKLILHELNREFGGSAEAVGKTLPGQLSKLRENFNNLAGDLVGGLVPAFSSAIGALGGFVSRISQAQGFHAKLAVIWEGISDAATGAAQALGNAVASIDWNAVWSQTKGIAAGLARRLAAVDWSGIWGGVQGIGAGLAAAITAQVAAVNWTAVGKTVGDAIGEAISFSAQSAGRIAGEIQAVLGRINWNAVGRTVGPGLAAAMAAAFATLTDPVFWAKNWDLALAVALTVFGGSIAKIAGRLLLPLRQLFTRTFEDAILAVAGPIERLSPRLGEAVLSGLQRLPGAAAALVGKIVAPVASTFARLGKVAQFVVKVVGIDIAINAVAKFATEAAAQVADWARAVKAKIDQVVAWFAGLPGRILGALGGLGGLLIGAGEALIGGLIAGIESKWNAVKAKLNALKNAIVGWKGPPSEDAVLLTRSGELIIEGLIRGFNNRLAHVKAALSGITGEILKIQQAAEDRSNAAALVDAQQAVAAARKKGEGVAAAERQLSDALDAIRVTRLTRQQAALQAMADAQQAALDKQQAALDKLKTAEDAALELRKATLQRWADQMAAIHQKTVDRITAAWSSLGNFAQQALQAISGQFVSKAQQKIDAIMQGRQVASLQKAITDAQAELATAQAGTTNAETGVVTVDQAAVAAAQQKLNEARQDMLINGPGGLQDQAAAEQKAHDQREADKERRLPADLAALEARLQKQHATYNTSLAAITKLLNSYGIDFANAGTALGGAFVQALTAAISSASFTISLSTSGGAGNRPDNRAGIRGAASGVRAWQGGPLLIGERGPEVLNLPRGSNVTPIAGGPVVNVTVGSVVGQGGMQQLAETIRLEIARHDRRNGR